MASSKTMSNKRVRRASQNTSADTPKRTRRKRAPRPAVKAELPEPIATFVF